MQTHTHTRCNLRAACLAKNSFDFLFRHNLSWLNGILRPATVFTCIKRDMKSSASMRSIQACGKWFSTTICHSEDKGHSHRTYKRWPSSIVFFLCYTHPRVYVNGNVHNKKYQSLNWSFIIIGTYTMRMLRRDRYWNKFGWMTQLLLLLHIRWPGTAFRCLWPPTHTCRNPLLRKLYNI